METDAGEGILTAQEPKVSVIEQKKKKQRSILEEQQKLFKRNWAKSKEEAKRQAKYLKQQQEQQQQEIQARGEHIISIISNIKKEKIKVKKKENQK